MLLCFEREASIRIVNALEFGKVAETRFIHKVRSIFGHLEIDAGVLVAEGVIDSENECFLKRIGILSAYYRLAFSDLYQLESAKVIE